MSDNSVTREVKVRLSVDCSNVLKGLTRLQQQINNVSVKKLRDKLILAGKDDFLSGVKDNVAKLEQSYEKANKALQRYIDTESKKISLTTLPKITNSL